MSYRHSSTELSQTTDATPRYESRRSASFHDTAARALYGVRFSAIAIPAVAAGVAQARSRRVTPPVHELPAILRKGCDD